MKKIMLLLVVFFVVASTASQVYLEADWKFVGDGTWNIVQGEVTNISSQPIRKLRAVVTFYDANKEMVTHEWHPIEASTLHPDETVPFRVRIRHDPRIRTATLRFRQGSGEYVSHKDKK